jgi:hypothetical protein
MLHFVEQSPQICFFVDRFVGEIRWTKLCAGAVPGAAGTLGGMTGSLQTMGGRAGTRFWMRMS